MDLIAEVGSEIDKIEDNYNQNEDTDDIGGVNVECFLVSLKKCILIR